MTVAQTKHDLKPRASNLKPLVEAALAETGGLLRLAPCWVPRSFLQPGKRLKLHPGPLVCLRYVGSEVNPDAPAMGAYKNN